MTIPPLEAATAADVFAESNESPFGAIDSNIHAWLSADYPATQECLIEGWILKEHRDNLELIEFLGGFDLVRKIHIFTPQQIRFLAEQPADQSPLQRNGFSNLFFVSSLKDQNLYIVGVVWDESVGKFVPYVYRVRNLYRSWSKGNQVFCKNT